MDGRATPFRARVDGPHRPNQRIPQVTAGPERFGCRQEPQARHGPPPTYRSNRTAVSITNCPPPPRGSTRPHSPSASPGALAEDQRKTRADQGGCRHERAGVSLTDSRSLSLSLSDRDTPPTHSSGCVAPSSAFAIFALAASSWPSMPPCNERWITSRELPVRPATSAIDILYGFKARARRPRGTLRDKAWAKRHPFHPPYRASHFRCHPIVRQTHPVEREARMAVVEARARALASFKWRHPAGS